MGIVLKGENLGDGGKKVNKLIQKVDKSAQMVYWGSLNAAWFLRKRKKLHPITFKGPCCKQDIILTTSCTQGGLK